MATDPYDRETVQRQRGPMPLPLEPGAAVERWTPAGPIRIVGSSERVDELAVQTAATVGDAAPLGLAGFAAATFTVSTINAGWIGSAALIACVPILAVFGGITQFIAGMWSYRKGDTFGATAFGSFGAFNTLFAAMIVMNQMGTISLTSEPVVAATGVILLMFALIAAYLTVAASRVSGVLVAVLGVLALTYLLLGVGFLAGGANGWIVIGGYAGLVTSVLAFYASAAIVLNSTARHEMLPF